MKKLKLLSAVLAAGMVLTATATGCKSKTTNPKSGYPTDGRVYNDFKVGGSAIIGSNTELKGDFRWTGLGTGSAQASDQDIQKLTSGYTTMEVDKSGNYVWNKTVVKSHKEEEVDNGEEAPTFKITITLNDGLKLSDGSEVKADNYLAYPLVMSTPVSAAAFKYNRAGYSFVGWSEFRKYDGTNAATEGVAKAFSGIRKLSDYSFSIEINSDNYPYYYVDTLGAVSCYDTKLLLGSNVEIKDDGEGAYLSDAWYEKSGDAYTKASHLTTARYDVSQYAYSGPYTVKTWDKSNLEATLELNANYAGNYEGQKPHIKTVVYKKVVSELQFGQLENGQVDILAGLTGSAPVNNAINLAKGGKFKNSIYERAGYGKIEFECDFGPTADTEVRQALAYCLNRTEFANTFCGGFGSVVHGPYSVNFDAYIANESYLEEKLNTYALSESKAKEALIAAGYIYDKDGKEYKSGIRYRKLTAEEAKDTAYTNYESVGDVNNYSSLASKFATTKVGNDYFMPCVINWFGTTPNEVTDLLNTKLVQTNTLLNCGIGIGLTVGDFNMLIDNIYREGENYSGTPTYGMYNLATGWNVAVYDYSYNWIDKSNEEMYDYWFTNSANKLSDPYDAKFSWWTTANQGLTYEQAVKASNGQLGMNYISMAMVYSVSRNDTKEFNKWFAAYMVRWNELLPDIPLYGNIYYDCFNAKLLNFKTTPFFGAAEALLYCGDSTVQ